MALTTYCPGQNEENYDNSVRIAGSLAKWKGAKDSKFHEHENS